MRAVAIIPARAGSVRIPNKNIRPFHGKPIIAYSIECALNSCIFDGVYVSTDSEEIAKIARESGASVIMRPTCDGAKGTQEVMREALEALGRTDGHACCLYATAPTLKSNVLRDAFGYILTTKNDYIIPVATWLQDPGQFYFGTTQAFLRGVPLIGIGTGMIHVPINTECDINVESDWLKAEEMYLALKGKS